jgi:hypothetical protein
MKELIEELRNDFISEIDNILPQETGLYCGVLMESVDKIINELKSKLPQVKTIGVDGGADNGEIYYVIQDNKIEFTASYCIYYKGEEEYDFWLTFGHVHRDVKNDDKYISINEINSLLGLSDNQGEG